MKKRAISLLLVLVSVFCLGIPALAAETVEEAEEAAILWGEADAGPSLDGAAQSGWTSEDGVWYYYSGGARKTGWLQTGGHWYYLDPKTDGAMATGWQDINGATYYFFHADGAMATGWQKLDGKWYYFGSSGHRQSGWARVSGVWYYLDPEDNGAMVTGGRDVDGSSYYFQSSGAMKTGWQSADGAWHYYTSSGAMKTGWLKISGVWYYLDPENGGAMVTGRQEIDGDVYWFRSSGAMATGWQKIDGKWYYFQSSGAMKTGWLQTGGHWYYLDPEAGGAMATGWQDIDNATYYFFYADGAMATGWKKLDGKWYYFASSGVKQTGWLKLSGLWYYLDPAADGAMATGWRDDIDEGVTYYFWSGGRMSDRPTYIGGSMYYFKSSGALQRNTSLTYCGKKYTVDENGVIQGYVTAAMQKAVSVLNQVGWDLYSAFRWSANLTYYGRWLRAPSGATHTEWYANYGFTNHCGNCFIINATFYQMAKALGYDVHFVEGGVLSRGGYLAPHGWVEIVSNGYTYVCDPEFQGATGYNGYFIWYGKSMTWRYSSYSRVS